MMLIRPLMTNFKMTSELPVLFLHGAPPSAYKSSCPLIVGVAGAGGGGSWPSDRHPPFPPVAGIQNKANFPFHQPGLFIGFWAASSRTPLSVKIPLTFLSCVIRQCASHRQCHAWCIKWAHTEVMSGYLWVPPRYLHSGRLRQFRDTKL